MSSAAIVFLGFGVVTLVIVIAALRRRPAERGGKTDATPGFYAESGHGHDGDGSGGVSEGDGGGSGD